MKLDLKAETEELTQRCDGENQRLNEQLTEKLDSEIMSVICTVSHVQGEGETEFMAAKKSTDIARGIYNEN
jgi:hypothetical protein